ncbi:MAG: V-type ATP synthase subunit D [Candidatus Omnitrophota bacterium]
MTKIKLTKGELKRQRDALVQYQRYLPTLQLKKQQLQMEILQQSQALESIRQKQAAKRNEIERWAGLLSDRGVDLKPWVKPEDIFSSARNIAGVDLPIFERVDFKVAEYDLFIMPLWVDLGLEALKALVSLREEIKVILKGIEVLRGELRITTQRVNLFEKVKIPEAKEAIRLIKIYIGDQMTNAVGRCKIAKRKIEALELSEAIA